MKNFLFTLFFVCALIGSDLEATFSSKCWEVIKKIDYAKAGRYTTVTLSIVTLGAAADFLISKLPPTMEVLAPSLNGVKTVLIVASTAIFLEPLYSVAKNRIFSFINKNSAPDPWSNLQTSFAVNQQMMNNLIMQNVTGATLIFLQIPKIMQEGDIHYVADLLIYILQQRQDIFSFLPYDEPQIKKLVTVNFNQIESSQLDQLWIVMASKVKNQQSLDENYVRKILKFWFGPEMVEKFNAALVTAPLKTSP